MSVPTGSAQEGVLLREVVVDLAEVVDVAAADVTLETSLAGYRVGDVVRRDLVLGRVGVVEIDLPVFSGRDEVVELLLLLFGRQLEVVGVVFRRLGVTTGRQEVVERFLVVVADDGVDSRVVVVVLLLLRGRDVVPDVEVVETLAEKFQNVRTLAFLQIVLLQEKCQKLFSSKEFTYSYLKLKRSDSRLANGSEVNSTNSQNC